MFNYSDWTNNKFLLESVVSDTLGFQLLMLMELYRYQPQICAMKMIQIQEDHGVILQPSFGGMIMCDNEKCMFVYIFDLTS